MNFTVKTHRYFSVYTARFDLRRTDFEFDVCVCSRFAIFRFDPTLIVMHLSRLSCIKVSLVFVSFALFLIFVHHLIKYLYNKYDWVQPPWPSKPIKILHFQHLAQANNASQHSRILCWISTYPKNRQVRKIFAT